MTPPRRPSDPPPVHDELKIIDQVPDEMDDNIQEVDEASLGNIKVLVSPAGSPRAAEGQGHVD